MALRPEAVSLNGAGGKRNRLDGTIEEVNFLGSVVRIRVRFKENAVSLDTFNNPNAPPPEARRAGHRQLRAGGSAGPGEPSPRTD